MSMEGFSSREFYSSPTEQSHPRERQYYTECALRDRLGRGDGDLDLSTPIQMAT